ncbi:UDP-glucose 4-epimerase [Acididesulfobacillus acetoxydans]|uniref:UDP-glucose 4-epimerase n=1 Tax=Acididesulfobacillus acetoxydans TaxID=1561005 RepID=A0A8S0W821_9FIRM|nr:UDP-glucose 4-epimerase GalE [Acididesulfobacillus acetoxydans]CAA7601399.1 UDP-glucose 4-epimerase [Acididesulfobacillus acetoxydans]CEJ08830.1 UDP-glucose 4-epimerase [Acididesulfobacillus acetoxydans]
MAILVTGGAGYIGSHTVRELLEQGEKVVVLDNLCKGHAAVVPEGLLVRGDVQDKELLHRLFRRYEIEAVIHFAAFSLVGESVQEPLKYYENNVVTAQRLLTVMQEYGIKKFVLSSTAATYGDPQGIPIQETDPTIPTNPYGETKLAIEKMLRWCDVAYGIKSVALRYFNAAGAHPEGDIGEDHRPESHLIPLILQVALGQRDTISIYGDDYETQDGTCIRDYIHVMDLAQAHWLALKLLREKGTGGIYNLGNGQGFSVKEVIARTRAVTGHPIPSRVSARRAGDPAVLVASAAKAESELGWRPKHSGLGEIIASAWNWHRRHPSGFADHEAD